jgi:protein-tyrosine-phosphatase
MNAVRSPMAAAILSHLTGQRIRVASAGVRAGHSDPYMIAVMDEIGIDLSDHEPQQLKNIEGETFDLIISLSPEAHHHAIESTRTSPADVEYWATQDATIYSDSETREEKLSRYRRVRDELFQKIKARFAATSGASV